MHVRINFQEQIEPTRYVTLSRGQKNGAFGVADWPPKLFCSG